MSLSQAWKQLGLSWDSLLPRCSKILTFHLSIVIEYSAESFRHYRCLLNQRVERLRFNVQSCCPRCRRHFLKSLFIFTGAGACSLIVKLDLPSFHQFFSLFLSSSSRSTDVLSTLLFFSGLCATQFFQFKLLTILNSMTPCFVLYYILCPVNQPKN